MGQRDAKRAAWALMVMALARPASSALLTLSSVETITSFSVPLSCIFAYNTPIFGCDLADFMNTNQCSNACKQALGRVESNIRASCVTVDAKPNTLIYEAQNGNLVNALCQKSSSKPSSTRPPRPPPPPPPSSTTSCDDSRTCTEPTVTSTITATTRITPRPVPTSRISEEETSSTSSTSIESTSSASTETSTQVKENEASSSSSSVSTPATTTTEIRPAQIPGSGGGSPFEIPLDQLAQGTRVEGRLLGVAGVVFAAIFM